MPIVHTVAHPMEYLFDLSLLCLALLPLQVIAFFPYMVIGQGKFLCALPHFCFSSSG